MRNFRLVIVLLTLLLCIEKVFAQGMLYGLTMPIDGKSMRITSTMRMGKDGKYDRTAPPTGDLSEHSNYDNFRVAAGQTHVVMDEKGPGVITHLWFTFLGPEAQTWAPQGSANHQEMLIRITFDGADKPQVEAPFGDFFANAYGKRADVNSIPVMVEDGDSYNCFWPMPFQKSAKIEIVNQSTKNVNLLYYNIDWIKKTKLPKDTPYFHAQYRQEYPAVNGRDYTILETEGKGHYVGTVLSVRTRSPSWFGEGDEKIYIDGEDKPSIWGTGTEDYFLSAWGLKKSSNLYVGVPQFDQWGIVGGHTSAYRWHINDPIVFQKGLKVTIEHYGWMSPDENPMYKSMSWNEREDDFSSVAFWYQTGKSTFTAKTPPAAERKLPSIERKIIQPAQVSNLKHGPGNVQKQTLDVLEFPQALYMPEEAKGAFIEMPFSIERKEPLRLLINMATSYDFGKYQATLNGVKIGGVMDFYSKDIGVQEFHLLDFWPEPGDYVLRLECVGKSHSSEGFFLGAESLRLRERRPRVERMGHDKDKDWRKDPKLWG